MIAAIATGAIALLAIAVAVVGRARAKRAREKATSGRRRGDDMLKTVEVSGTTIEYQDTGGDGPVVVPVHGLLMDTSLWSEVVECLGEGFRCVVPTLPLGAHRHPFRADGDYSIRAIAALLDEFLRVLDLRDVTLVGNDTGGALVQVMLTKPSDRIARVALVSCDAFENFPPGLTGKTIVLLGKLPPSVFGLFMQQMRLKPIRRLPISFGWLTKRGDSVTAAWLSPLYKDAVIRRDIIGLLRAMNRERGLLVEVASAFPDFDRPVLVVWASEDRVMPVEHARRLVDVFPHAQLVEVADSYSLIPLDQPGRLADSIRHFVDAGRVSSTGGPDAIL